MWRTRSGQSAGTTGCAVIEAKRGREWSEGREVRGQRVGKGTRREKRKDQSPDASDMGMV